MFENFFNNPMFILIMVMTVGVQIALVEYGGEAVKCSPLSLQQHLYCISIGFLSIIVGFFVKFIPIDLFSIFKVNETPLETEEERAAAFQSSLRKSRSLYKMSSRNLNLSRDNKGLLRKTSSKKNL